MANDETPGARRGSRASRLWTWAALVLVAIVLAGLIRGLVFQVFEIPSTSMQPTLTPGDRIAVWRPASFAEPRRGDVVVIDGRGSFLGGTPPTGTDTALGWFGLGNSDVYYVKRVIGIGGDTVECCSPEGQLIRNGEALAEPYLADPGEPASDLAFSVEVPEGRVWLMGDNRNDSDDSRALLGAPGGGMIPEARIIGRATMILWPRTQGAPDSLP